MSLNQNEETSVSTKQVSIEQNYAQASTFNEIKTTVLIKRNQLYSDEEIELIALVTMAEAEGESEEGQRLVIDTILNRVDHERFPDTINEVIYQPNQFTSMWNGRVDRCYVIENRTNHEVMFFTAGRYGKYGTPMFQVGNHYFSSYD